MVGIEESQDIFHHRFLLMPLLKMQLLSSLDNANIIAYKESFMDKDQSLCIVTYFCEEGDLFNKIKARAATQQYFNEDDIMDIFIQVMLPPVPGTFFVASDLLSWPMSACWTVIGFIWLNTKTLSG